MEKQATVRPLMERWFGLDRGWEKRLVHRLVHMWNLPVLVMAFLLGRATILDAVSPFSLAFFVVMFHLSRRSWPLVAAMLISGAATVSQEQAVKTFAFLAIAWAMIKILAYLGKGQIDSAPLAIFLTSIVGHLIWIFHDAASSYSYLLAGVELTLSFILCFIFVQALPFFTTRKQRIGLRHEEMICLVILLGSVMTGTLDWKIADLSVVHILSRYLILVLAYVGGGMLGASMGVVTGLILNLSNPKAIFQISILAFGGMLAGLFQESKRIGVALGFLLGSTILVLYSPQTMNLWTALLESAIAILLFFFTPSMVLNEVSRWVPGTRENLTAHQEYLRRMRDVTAAKVEQFTELFYELASSFREDSSKQRKEEEDQVHQFISNVMENSCMGCAHFSRCWEQNMMQTYQGMTQLMTYVEIKGVHQEIPVPEGWRQYCVRPEQVVKGLQHQYAYHEQTMYWKEKISESRRMVTEQLTGLAEVMEKLAGEIRRESQVMTAQEEQIYQALEEMGIAVDRVDLYSLEEGKVEIEITLPHPDSLDECKKLIAPMLSELIGEPIDVYRKVIREGSNRAVIALGSAQKFSCKTGVASKAKGGSYISGDSYCYMNLGVGKYAVALSDGMGNGARAQEESSAALKLLRRLLLAGMNEERAIETINSLLSLRSSDEVFATMDLAMVDLNTADGRFMKIGSHPSFIKRGRKVIQLSSGNPPIGILNQIEVEPIEIKLQPGDLLVMMTDGVYDLGKSYANKESAVIRMIQEIDSKDPQDFASQLLEKAIRSRKGKIDDDMTVIVTKVERHAPEWSTIRLPGLSPLNARSEKWV